MNSAVTISRLEDAAGHLRHTIRTATAGLVGREQLAELIVLAAVAQEHLLVIGPPGTGKSAVVRRVAQALGGRYFEYLELRARIGSFETDHGFQQRSDLRLCLVA